MIKKLLLIFLTLVIGTLLFYWFQIRPSEIRSYCDWYGKWGWQGSHGYVSSKYYQDNYDSCLHEKGLK